MKVTKNVKTNNQISAYNDFVENYSSSGGMSYNNRLTNLISDLLTKRFGVSQEKLKEMRISLKSGAVKLLFTSKLLSKLEMKEEAKYVGELGVNRLVRATANETETAQIVKGASGFSISELGLEYAKVLELNLGKVLPSIAFGGTKFSRYEDFRLEMNELRTVIGEAPLKSVQSSNEFSSEILSDLNKVEQIALNASKGGNLSSLNPRLGFSANLPQTEGIFC